MNLADIFEKHNEEYLEFDRVQNKMSSRRDVHAFILLDKLLPGLTEDIVGCAEHDEIWLSTNIEDFARVATEEIVIELLRCGVLYDTSLDCLRMNV